MKLDAKLISVIISAATAGASLAYAFFQKKKLDDISDKLGRKIDEIANNADIDISEDIIERATEKAIEKKTAETAKLVHKQIEEEVSKKINAQYQDVKKDVTDELMAKVTQLDLDKLKDDVMKNSKDLVARKVESSMDSLLRDYKSQLNRIARAFTSGAGASNTDIFKFF